MEQATFTLGGDPSAIRASAARWLGESTAAALAQAQVTTLVATDFVGTEGDQHAHWLTGQFAPQLGGVSDAGRQVGAALLTFAGVLEDCQRRLARVAQQADDDQARITAAQRADHNDPDRQARQLADAQSGWAATV